MKMFPRAGKVSCQQFCGKGGQGEEMAGQGGRDGRHTHTHTPHEYMLKIYEKK